VNHYGFEGANGSTLPNVGWKDEGTEKKEVCENKKTDLAIRKVLILLIVSKLR